jgi:hypothetical protein
MVFPEIRTFITIAALLVLLTPPPSSSGASESRSVDQIILEAGNADDDAVRLKLLMELQAMPGLDDTLRVEIDRVVVLIERWIGDPQLFQWFHREIRRTLDYDLGVRETSPLYPITCIYRGRMLVWTANEFGYILGYHDERRRFLDRAVELFRIAAEAFPENRIVRMYLGEPIPPAKQYPSVPNAPDWAVYQRESLERLTDLILWWIENRLQEDGQYGGGWDDDCEMWRHWVPAMIAFEHPEISEAQAFFSRALLSQDFVKRLS